MFLLVFVCPQSITGVSARWGEGVHSPKQMATDTGGTHRTECMLVLHGIYLVQERLSDFLEIRISRFQERRAAKRTFDYLYEIWFSATLSIATPCAKGLFSLVYSCLTYS